MIRENGFLNKAPNSSFTGNSNEQTDSVEHDHAGRIL